MPNELEYIVKDALMMCDKGTTPVPFMPTSNATIKISGCLVTTKLDKQPIVNIPPFGACSVKNGSPCVLVPTEWQNTYKVKVKGQQTLLYKSKMQCGVGGKIEFITSGQVPLPPEEYDKLLEEHGEEEEELSWWDAAELIPFIGGVIGVVRSASKDPTDWLGVGLSVLSIGLDIGGLFSFGAGNAASATVKAGKLARVGVKVAKATTRAGKVLKLGAKAGKAFAIAAAKSVDNIALKTGKVCVFACFPAGTLIATKDGQKPIEEIRVGDFVWAYDEDTGKSDLKEVLNTIEKEVDATIEIILDNEYIETTAEHPFFTQNGWKDAGDLTTTDKLKTKNGNWQQIKAANFLYAKKKVYNFEVADWHTYFVGIWQWLVHNSGVCLSAPIRAMIQFVKPNRIHHIMDNKHLWGKLFPNPDWSKVSGVLGEVIDNGIKMSYKGNGTSKYIGQIKGSTVEVIVRQGLDGTKRIVDAWVRNPGLK